MWRRETERLIDSTADHIFASLATRCPDLEVVAFHMPEFTSQDKPYTFLRSKQTDLRDHETFKGTAVESSMVKHHEPCSDILRPEQLNFGFWEGRRR